MKAHWGAGTPTQPRGRPADPMVGTGDRLVARSHRTGGGLRARDCQASLLPTRGQRRFRPVRLDAFPGRGEWTCFPDDRQSGFPESRSRRPGVEKTIFIAWIQNFDERRAMSCHGGGDRRGERPVSLAAGASADAYGRANCTITGQGSVSLRARAAAPDFSGRGVGEIPIRTKGPVDRPRSREHARRDDARRVRDSE